MLTLENLKMRLFQRKLLWKDLFPLRVMETLKLEKCFNCIKYCYWSVFTWLYLSVIRDCLIVISSMKQKKDFLTKGKYIVRFLRPLKVKRVLLLLTGNLLDCKLFKVWRVYVISKFQINTCMICYNVYLWTIVETD